MRKRLIVLLWLGLYVLCLWLAVRAAAEAQQISPDNHISIKSLADFAYLQPIREEKYQD